MAEQPPGMGCSDGTQHGQSPGCTAWYLHVYWEATVHGEGKGSLGHSQDQRVPLAVHEAGAPEGHTGLPGTSQVLGEK